MPHDARSSARSAALSDAGTEPLEVDAVAEVAQLARGDEVAAPQELDVLDVLDQLDVGPARGERLERVHDRTAGQWIVRRRVQAVDGVDDDRHAGEATDDPPVQPGLRVVRVQHRRSLAAQDPPQLARRAEIGPRVPAAGRCDERDVPHAAPLERRRRTARAR